MPSFVFVCGMMGVARFNSNGERQLGRLLAKGTQQPGTAADHAHSDTRTRLDKARGAVGLL